MPEQPKPKVLIVEDDDFFGPVLERCLSAQGYEATMAASGVQAKQLIALNQYDAVVSDINLPDTNGVELLRWIRNGRGTPVILMTGFTDAAETLAAHESGAAGFLAKPFMKEDLIAALNSAMPKSRKGNDATRDMDADFCKVTLDDFVSGSDINYDIFVRISSSKYVKIAHNGQDITLDQIKAYKNKGISFLYLSKEDFRRYVQFSARLAQAVSKSKFSVEKKLNFLKHTTELVAESLFEGLLDAESVASSRTIVESATSILTDSDDAFMVLEMLKTNADFIYAHSVAVSFYSVLIARKLKWKAQPTLFKLSISALFHDIGMKELPKELLLKPRKEYSFEDTAHFESHTVRGAQILTEMQDLPSDTFQIALEHHENCIGLGYPRRIKKDKIHPLSRVVTVADEFCNLAMRTPTGQAMEPHQAINRMMMFNPEYFDPEAFQALMELLKFQVPEGFIENMRRRQRMA